MKDLLSILVLFICSCNLTYHKNEGERIELDVKKLTINESGRYTLIVLPKQNSSFQAIYTDTYYIGYGNVQSSLKLIHCDSLHKSYIFVDKRGILDFKICGDSLNIDIISD